MPVQWKILEENAAEEHTEEGNDSEEANAEKKE